MKYCLYKPTRNHSEWDNINRIFFLKEAYLLNIKTNVTLAEASFGLSDQPSGVYFGFWFFRCEVCRDLASLMTWLTPLQWHIVKTWGKNTQKNWLTLCFCDCFDFYVCGVAHILMLWCTQSVCVSMIDLTALMTAALKLTKKLVQLLHAASVCRGAGRPELHTSFHSSKRHFDTRVCAPPWLPSPNLLCWTNFLMFDSRQLNFLRFSEDNIEM